MPFRRLFIVKQLNNTHLSFALQKYLWSRNLIIIEHRLRKLGFNPGPTNYSYWHSVHKPNEGVEFRLQTPALW